MDFGLNDEQEMIVSTVRRFVEREIYPHEAEVERTGQVPYDVGQEIKRKVIDLGFYACNFPQDIGGAGLIPGQDFAQAGRLHLARDDGLERDHGIGAHVARGQCRAGEIDELLEGHSIAAFGRKVGPERHAGQVKQIGLRHHGLRGHRRQASQPVERRRDAGDGAGRRGELRLYERRKGPVIRRLCRAQIGHVLSDRHGIGAELGIVVVLREGRQGQAKGQAQGQGQGQG